MELQRPSWILAHVSITKWTIGPFIDPKLTDYIEDEQTETFGFVLQIEKQEIIHNKFINNLQVLLTNYMKMTNELYEQQ